jgi:hypothetical protein
MEGGRRWHVRMAAMLEHTATFGFSFGFVVAITAGAGVRRARHLEDKLRVLGRMLVLQAVGLLAVGIALMVAPRVRVAATGDDPAAVQAALRLLAEHDQQQTMHLAALGFVVVAGLPVWVHVVRALASFVLAHRTDLLAREQAAVYLAPPAAAR